jgi:hypothetical protein
VKPDRHGIVDFHRHQQGDGRGRPRDEQPAARPALWNIMSERAARSASSDGGRPSRPRRSTDTSSPTASPTSSSASRPTRPAEGKTWPPDLYEKLRPLVVAPQAVSDDFAARFLDDPSILKTAEPEQQELLRQFKTILASGESYRKIAATLQSRFDPDIESVYIEGTDTVAHLFMRFRPPRMPGVTDEEARAYASVVDRYYAYADELVGEIVARHGKDANYVVCSDHGFRSGQDRPLTADSRIDRGAGAEWHRKYGILIVSDPRRSTRREVPEATVYDVAPTVLALAGVGFPSNLDGRVLTDAIADEFLRAHPLRTLEPSPGAGTPDRPGPPARPRSRPRTTKRSGRGSSRSAT